MPGIGEFGTNRVRLLEVNEGFVAAFLVGANHEWAREALWAEFPASLAATAFSTFWEHPGGAATSRRTSTIGRKARRSPTNRGGRAPPPSYSYGATSIRRYPAVAFFAAEPARRPPPVHEDGTIPAAHITCRRSARCSTRTRSSSASTSTPRTVLDEGWYVCLEEPFTQPRAGFDQPEAGADLRQSPRARAGPSSRGGGRGHPAEAYAAMTTSASAGAPWLDDHELDDVTWGRNSAHMAGITFQQPFRFMILPAT